MIQFNALAWIKYVCINKIYFYGKLSRFLYRLIALILIATKVFQSCSISSPSTRKYFFDSVADFDDIVENNYEGNSGNGGIASESVESTSFYHKTLSPIDHIARKSKNSYEISDINNIKKMNMFKRASNSAFRRPFALPTWKRSQDINKLPYEMSKVYLTKDHTPEKSLYFVKAKLPSTERAESSQTEGKILLSGNKIV